MKSLALFLTCVVAKVLLLGILYGVLTTINASETLFYAFYALVALAAVKLFFGYRCHEKCSANQYNR